MGRPRRAVGDASPERPGFAPLARVSGEGCADARRCLRLLGALSLAVWTAMLALAILAWAAIPVWPPHARPRGVPLPPRPGACVFDAVVGIATVDCRDIPAASLIGDVLIGDVLTYAAYWVLLFPTLPIWAPHL